ncbi:MAG: DNA (cytosine-5-)-methyltransferase [Acidimicrobiaceae bacterium]|nr:DNA (cytosine-5-)-methyltransferase [Acidimicrobiaceae bacterium]
MVEATVRKYGVTHRRSKPLRLSPHPDAPADEGWSEWVRSSMRGSTKPVAVDLFCGAGGLSHGLEAAGYRVLLAADTDEWALESHRHNLASRAMRLDLADPQARQQIVSLLDGVDVGLIAGGPPCQPFSRAGLSKIRSLVDQGHRNADDNRRDLWRAFLELVETIRPRAMLMENVPDMALGDGFMVIRAMIERLGEIGYEADARIVDAWRHGVPQHRQRLILVALRDAVAFEWPSESDPVTVRHAIHDLPRLSVSPDTMLGAPAMPYGEPLSDFAVRARHGCAGDSAEVVYDHVTRPVRADDFEAFKLMHGRTLYSDLPESLRRYRADIFNDKYNRLSWDELSRTVTAHLAKDGYWYIHPEQHRSLTVREAARLQTFPDAFRFAGCRSHQFQQIGNAVPPRLAQRIGSSILDSVRRGRGSGRASPGATRPLRSLRVRRSTFREAMLRWVETDSHAVSAVEAIRQNDAQNRRWTALMAGGGSDLVASAPALRVASRVSGSHNGGRASGSTARMELAKLVGFDGRTASLNIAAHVLGTIICRPRDPRCGSCPVAAVCASRPSADPSAPKLATPATAAG